LPSGSPRGTGPRPPFDTRANDPTAFFASFIFDDPAMLLYLPDRILSPATLFDVYAGRSCLIAFAVMRRPERIAAVTSLFLLRFRLPAFTSRCFIELMSNDIVTCVPGGMCLVMASCSFHRVPEFILRLPIAITAPPFVSAVGSHHAPDRYQSRSESHRRFRRTQVACLVSPLPSACCTGTTTHNQPSH